MKTKQLIDAGKKDAVFQASIEFIGTLTGMKPPPIETAPPETFAPFRAFTERVCEIFADIAEPVEPVAWMRDGATSVLHNFVLSKPDSGPWIPLYTTPQKPAAAEWMPIETAPKDGTPIDIWRSSNGGERCAEMRRVDLGSGNVFYEPIHSGYSCVRYATHWMQLPAAPGCAA